MIFGIIYKATNLVNGKCYIGQTTKEPVKYWINHLKNAFKSENNEKYFYKAIRKYGPENFMFEVLEFCDSKEELNEMEFHYIKQYKSYNYDQISHGYNCTIGGDGTPGHKKSKESCKNLSIRQTELWQNEDFKEKMKNVHNSNEHREKMTNIKIELWQNEDFKEKMKNVFDSEDFKEKISITSKERYNNEEYKKNWRDKMTKNLENEEYKRNWLTKVKEGHNKIKKRYILTFPNGEEKEILGLKEICEEYNLTRSNLTKTLNGSRKHHKGFKIRYKEIGEINEI